MARINGLKSRLGMSLFAVILISDQITKQLVLASIERFELIEVTSFFNLVLVWNTGVSFGMFQNDGTTGRWLLVALAIIISSVIIYLLMREKHRLPQLAYWLVLAGALGNVIDRVIYGAVIDFLDVHLNNYHWPAFNVADSAIVVGALMLVVDSFTRKEQE